MALGIAHGYASFYRYGANDCATEQARPRAISYVLAGGLMAAFFGSEIAPNMVQWVPHYLYAGFYFFGICDAAYFTAGICWGGNSKTQPCPCRWTALGLFFHNPVFFVGMAC